MSEEKYKEDLSTSLGLEEQLGDHGGYGSLRFLLPVSSGLGGVFQQFIYVLIHSVKTVKGTP